MTANDIMLSHGPNALARLLRMASGAPAQGQPDDIKSELLSARLCGPLPPDPSIADDMQALAGRLRSRLPLNGQPIGDVLLEPGASVADLEKIKEYGKGLAARKDSEIEWAVAVTIYFAAIASALVAHDQKITSYTLSELADALATLIDKPWVPPELARLFSTARAVCRKKMT